MRLEFDGPMVLKANQLFTATLRVTLKETLQAGARVVLAVRHFSDIGHPQMSDPAAENFVAVRGPGSWELGPAQERGRHPWNLGIDLRLVSGTVPAGEPLSVALGDPAGGSPGYRCQSFAESAFRFRLGVDRDGRGDWSVLPLDACPTLRITGNQTTCLRVVVPRPTRNDGVVDVHVKPEDSYGNVAGETPSEATLLIEDSVPVARVALKPERAARARIHVPKDSSWRRLTAATADGRFWSRSNPFGPSPMEGHELFFGEIHAQSALCDGTNSPSELYEYAREAAGLDFAAVTSHDFELTARDWREIQVAAREANAPGEFVTFLGVEWSGRTPAGGDNNIYFLDDDGPLLYSAPHGGYEAWDPAEGEVLASRDLAQVIEELAGHRFMVVPHVGGRTCNLDYYDPAVMPLLEVHSCHHTFQDMAYESIRRGARFGFIGGSDDHRGALGDSHPPAREHFSNHNGLAAVYARDLTRASLWEAFFARRVYATNGPRIVLTTEINGLPMGSDVVAEPGAELALSFWTGLDGWMDRVEVMRDDGLIRTFYPRRNQTGEFSGEMDVRATKEPHAYHVRAYQTDGGWAWSSPIWVLPRDDREHTPNQAVRPAP